MIKAFISCITLLFFIIIQHSSKGQHLSLKQIKGNGERFSQKSAQIEKSRSYTLRSKSLFTSLSIQINERHTYNDAYLLIENDTFLLSRDEHVEARNELINSNLISFENPISTILFYSGSIENEVLFNFINGSVSQLKERKLKNSIKSNCLEEPLSIDQQIWRSGLQSPQYNRSFSAVKHLIIHHSAGSNSNTNYTQVVRDIYIYHIEVNGWSDIGYNYLIAQDGSIYKGRDPATGAQDNVRGAHFCGMNSGTMGICLLGDYTSIAPTDETIQSLLSIISWKLDKESLNAFENFSFNAISNLGSISGHRDGCATECPGTKTYQKIASFKHQANSVIESCYPDNLIADFTWNNKEIMQGESVSFIDVSQGSPLLWHWLLEGSVNEEYTQQNPSAVAYLNTGKFDVRLVIRNGARTDTATMNNLITVSENPFNEPSVFPNPVDYKTPILLTLNKEIIKEVEIINTKGETVLYFVPTKNQIEIDHASYNAGIYFVRFLANGRVVQSTKIMVIK